MNGILNINKPSGMSSAAAVGKVKRLLGTRAVGHMGTLDPIGEGVLMMGVGKGTRLFEYYLGKSKTYEAAFRFGVETDTLDVTGIETSRTDHVPTESEIIAALPRLIGACEQIPPIYSAKSIGGVRAYKLAREGKIPELKAASVTINALELLGQIGDDEYLFRIDCSSGTYVRSICRDLAYACGSLGLMTAIKRTRCGKYFVEDAVDLEKATMSDIIPLDNALSELDRFDAADADYKKLVNGVPVVSEGVPVGKFALYCRGELLGIANNTEEGIRIKTYLKEDSV